MDREFIGREIMSLISCFRSQEKKDWESTVYKKNVAKIPLPFLVRKCYIHLL